jgi:uncharacterized protein YcfJ
MKKISIVMTLALTSGLANAEGAVENGYVTDHYKMVIVSTPQTHHECRTVEVPIYGQTRNDDVAGAITGTIIGGAIGHQFGSGSGKDAMTALGAIIGARQGAKREGGVVGYRQEETCSNVTRHSRREERVYSHSTITFTDDQGQSRTVKFYK